MKTTMLFLIGLFTLLTSCEKEEELVECYSTYKYYNVKGQSIPYPVVVCPGDVINDCNCEVYKVTEKATSYKVWLTCISEHIVIQKDDHLPQVGDCYDK